jgi:hypothetical protein
MGSTGVLSDRTVTSSSLLGSSKIDDEGRNLLLLKKQLNWSNQLVGGVEKGVLFTKNKLMFQRHILPLVTIGHQ